MALFDDVDQKLSNWINAGTDKARGMSESMKISSDIKEEERNQEELYRQIGLFFYNNYAETAEGQLKDFCQKINQSKEQGILKQKRLSILKGMIHCPSCGAEIDFESVFCNVCGSRIQVIPTETKEENICPNCGKVINPNNTFCTGCGMKIETMSKEKQSDQIVVEGNKEEKRCPQCNAVIEDNQKFCISCGMNLEKLDDINNENTVLKNVCPNCGKEIADDDMFCINCGTRVKE